MSGSVGARVRTNGVRVVHHLERRREAAKNELVSEPAAIESLYEVRMSRLTPVGLVVAWPESMT